MVTIKQAAEKLNVSRKTVEKAIRYGQIRVIKFGDLIRIPDTEIERLLGPGEYMPGVEVVKKRSPATAKNARAISERGK